MRVSRAAFYAYRRGQTHQGTKAQADRRQKVRECFYLNRRRYGTRRIAAALEIGRFAARSAMRHENLRAIAPKRFRPATTDSRHDSPVSANLLRGGGAHQLTGKGWCVVGDITYLPLRDGKFCYLAIFQDKFTRRIVGWQVSNRMTAQIVIDAFLMARRRGLLRRGSIIHTDRGSQYVSVEYRRLLYTGGYRQSMSGKGNCYDNAQAESFFSRFKTELVEGGIFESVAQAKSEVFDYIEGYYNRVRLHSSLGYLSPLEFEKQLNLKTMKRRESFVS